MKIDKIDIILNINIKENNQEIIYILEDKINNFFFKYFFNKYKILTNTYFKSEDIRIIKDIFKINEDELEKNYNKNKIIFVENKIIKYNQISTQFILFYILIFKNIKYKKNNNILDISLQSSLFEVILYNNYKNNYSTYYNKLYLYNIKNNNYLYNIHINIKNDIDQIKNIYYDIKNYDLNFNFIDIEYSYKKIKEIINFYKNKNINIGFIESSTYNLLYYNNSNFIPYIIYNIIQLYIILDVLNDNGTLIYIIMNTLLKDYSRDIILILNSIFELKYVNIISGSNKFIIFKKYDKKKYITNYRKIFKDIIKKEYNNVKLYNIFDIKNYNYDNEFNKIYYKFNNIKYLSNIQNKISIYYNKNNQINLESFINIIKSLSSKYLIFTLKLLKKYNLEIKNIYNIKYDAILLKLNKYNINMNKEKKYIINNNNLNKDEINIIFVYLNNNEYFNDKKIQKLKLLKFYIDSLNKKKWKEITDIINIRKSIVYYIKNIFKKRISRAFVKMYEILTKCNLINFNNKYLNSFHICEAPGNFIIALNDFINNYNNKYNKNIILNWKANSLNPYNEINKNEFKNIIGDQYNLIKNNKYKWDWFDDNTGNINNLNNLNYIKNKYYNKFELLTSDCGLEAETIDNYLNKEDQMLLTNFSQILITLISVKINGSAILKIFIPFIYSFSYSLIYLLYNYFQELIFYKQSSGSLGSGEIYLICKNKFKELTDNEYKKLLEIYKKNNIKNLLLFEIINQDFINKINKIQNKMIKEQIKYINRSFIYYENEELFNEYKQNMKEYNNIYCKEWIFQNMNLNDIK